jgi:hypothetical protein
MWPESGCKERKHQANQASKKFHPKQIVKRICNIQSMQGTNMLCYAHCQTCAAARLPK